MRSSSVQNGEWVEHLQLPEASQDETVGVLDATILESLLQMQVCESHLSLSTGAYTRHVLKSHPALGNDTLSLGLCSFASALLL